MSRALSFSCKKKTAYERRISDWSSNLCSSDLLLRVAYDAGARRSELVAIEVGHIEGPDSDGAGTLFIPSSKTDREGEGAYAYLSPATMDAIARWREKAGIRQGPLIRRVETHFVGSVGIGRASVREGGCS